MSDISERALEMRERSGHEGSADILVIFLYLLARDHVPNGVIERVLDEALDISSTTAAFSNGWLARWAKDARDRLLGVQEIDFHDLERRVMEEVSGCETGRLETEENDKQAFRTVLEAVYDELLGAWSRGSGNPQAVREFADSLLLLIESHALEDDTNSVSDLLLEVQRERGIV